MIANQTDVIEFLSNPKSYSSLPEKIEIQETHGALVFIAGDDVYKIKKAIQFSYMDFSTLDLRENVCRREITINKKTAPDIYIDAVPITREENGDLAIDGQGTPVEWAVHMKRFDQSDVFSSLVDNDLITSSLICQLAKTVANYHASAPTKHHVDTVTQFSELIADLERIFTEFNTVFGSDGKHFAENARELLEKAKDCLISRAEHGYIRRCHGDLHLQNIVRIHDKPVLFDAIEFDENIATIDIFYDLAFLLMDLKQRGMKHAANLTFNRYLFHSWTTPNLEGLKAMPLFLACRAAIRAMVNAQKSAQKTGREHELLVETARSYMRSALESMETTAPRLIAVGGLSGTGKSTLAASLAPAIGNEPGALHLRSDLERKNMFEVEETEELPPQLYSSEINEKVYTTLFQKSELALKSGHSVIVDAVFRQEEKREAIELVAKRLNVPFSGIWLTAPETTLCNRVDNREGDASDADSNIVKKQINAGSGQISWKLVNSGGSVMDTVIEVSRFL